MSEIDYVPDFRKQQDYRCENTFTAVPDLNRPFFCPGRHGAGIKIVNIKKKYLHVIRFTHKGWSIFGAILLSNQSQFDSMSKSLRLKVQDFNAKQISIENNSPDLKTIHVIYESAETYQNIELNYFVWPVISTSPDITEYLNFICNKARFKTNVEYDNLHYCKLEDWPLKPQPSKFHQEALRLWQRSWLFCLLKFFSETKNPSPRPDKTQSI